ncbi:hypothetical protein ACWENQ_44870 [Nonomuraea sp. NPDC004354]
MDTNTAVTTGLIRGASSILAFQDRRGPRYAITGTIRRGEFYGAYARTAEEAEREAERQRDLGYYGVNTYAPIGSVDLEQLGRARVAARQAEREATEMLHAGVLRRAEQMAAEGEVNESALAREAGVDRMTIRSWLGKQ